MGDDVLQMDRLLLVWVFAGNSFATYHVSALVIGCDVDLNDGGDKI